MKIEIEVPDTFILRDGVAVLSGWDDETGEPAMRIVPIEEAPLWTQSGLFQQALIRTNTRMSQSWKDSNAS